MSDAGHIGPGHKRCNRCGVEKLANAFNDSGKTKDGLAATCRECVNRRRRELSRDKPKKPINLVDACKRGRVETVEKLLQQADDIPLALLLGLVVQDFSTIRKTGGHRQTAELLIGKGAPVSWHFVCEAARGGHQALVDLLLTALPDDNIHVGSCVGDIVSVNRILADDPTAGRQTVDAHVHETFIHHYRSMTALHYCCLSALGQDNPAKARDLADIARRLIETGCPVDGAAEYYGLSGVTPLFCLCWTGGNELIAQELIARVELDQSPYLGVALGHFQRHGKGHYPIADMLIAAGADPDYFDGGRTLLQTYSNQGDHRAVRWLIEHGVDVNAQDEFGRAALHHAAERNAGTRVTQLLLENGANDQLKDAQGYKAVDIARQNDKTKVAELLGGG